MPLPRFESLPVWLNLVVFGSAAAVVWLAGTRTSRYADAISERTGVGKAFVGALLLGGVTSLPEAATTFTASAIGNAPLAVNNIFGGIAMQIAILAAADAVVGGRALSAIIVRPSLLLEGALLILVLALGAAAILLGDHLWLGVGVWSAAIFSVSLFGFFLIQRHDPRETWEPEESNPDTGSSDEDEENSPAGTQTGGNGPGEARNSGQDENRSSQEGKQQEPQQSSLRGLILKTGLAAAAILAAGYVLSRTADALAEQTGLGSSFVGAVLLAISTSLPEVSTTLGAVRLGEHAMAVSNLFGANILDMSILFLADVVFPGGPVLNEVGRFSIAGALLGILLTAVYLVGMLERRKRVVLRIGFDSLVVLVLYLGGIIVLYQIR